MRKSYVLGWLLILAGAGLAAAWSLHGRAYVRRRFFSAASVAEAARAESQFVAILIPRIRRGGEKYTMSPAELTGLLRGLKDEGHISIGLSDIEDFYVRGRRLPSKALLIAFSENDPRGYALADRVLKRLRLRGVAFISRSAEEAGEDERQHLTRHAISEMRRTGGWDFGWRAADAPATASVAGVGRAVLEEEGRPGPPAGVARYPLRFKVSELGHNDALDDPRALRILGLRPERAALNLAIVRKTWPRATELSDDFHADGPGSDWIAGWGEISMGRRRLALLPAPRHTSAGVFLRGTDKWRDSTVEYTLKKYRKEFWAYARLRDGGGFVRVGARDGWWYAEQKSGPTNPVNMLARAQIGEGALPATVRFILKGGSLIVYLDGRMLFGRPLRLHPGVDRGSLFFGVYDGVSRSSRATLTSVRAAPLGEVWVAAGDLGREMDDRSLAALRDEAVYARALSPLWIRIAEDGGVLIDEAQSVLLRSMAGFYACRLVPMADGVSLRGTALAPGADADRLSRGLVSAVRDLNAGGLNLRLRGEEAGRPEAIAFLRKLRGLLRAQRRELWITVDGGGPLAPGLADAADGVLRSSGKTRRALELLDGAPRQADMRTQREPATNQ